MEEDAPSLPAGISKGLTATIAFAATCIGLLTGGFSMYWTLKDRMTKEIEDKVTDRIRTETRLTRIEEQIKAVQADMWVKKTTPSN